MTMEPFVFVVADFVLGTPAELNSTATVNATTGLDGIEIICTDLSSLENDTATIQVIGEYVQHFYL